MTDFFVVLVAVVAVAIVLGGMCLAVWGGGRIDVHQLHQDQYRWCLYCGTDCLPPPPEQHHWERCPTVTGIYPITAEDLALHMCCDTCHRPFQAGDTYMLDELDLADGTASPDIAVSLIVCVSCGRS